MRACRVEVDALAVDSLPVVRVEYGSLEPLRGPYLCILVVGSWSELAYPCLFHRARESSGGIKRNEHTSRKNVYACRGMRARAHMLGFHKAFLIPHSHILKTFSNSVTNLIDDASTHAVYLYHAGLKPLIFALRLPVGINDH